jgi:hypothetical protein
MKETIAGEKHNMSTEWSVGGGTDDEIRRREKAGG